jgi:cation diffusion facilitator family transporter
MRANQRRTLIVIGLTLVTMVLEIGAGMVFNSMALLADGWHMASHAGALGITAAAYHYARSRACDPRYTFGTGKIISLGGYTSAVTLFIVALLMVWESVERLLDPVGIGFNQAILVAVVGLAVNLASAWILGGHGHSHGHDHSHEHGHDHDHGHAHSGRDQNITAAYMHVLADALTSILAIAALLAGKYLGLGWMDPVMGLVGALVIAKWAVGLLRDTGRRLLDFTRDPDRARAIREALECESRGCAITDLHVWRVGEEAFAAIVAVRDPDPRPPGHYKEKLAHIPQLVHVSVEVNPDQG